MKRNIFYCPLNLGANRCGLEYGYNSFIKKFPKYKDEILFIDIQHDFNEDFSNKKLNFKRSVLKTLDYVSSIIDKNRKTENINILIGGDHSLAISSVSVSSKYKDIGLLWIDAHGDMNTDITTYSGNIHGMSVASLIGLGDKDLKNVFYDGQKIKKENVVIFGVRDLDDREEELMKEIGIKYFTINEIREKGFNNSLKKVNDYLKERVKDIHLSFDLDSISSEELSGISTPSDNGFTKEEGIQMISYFKKENKIKSIDIVEYNPLYEKNNDTASYIDEILRIF